VLSVPELPERESGVLTGTLYGRVEFEQGPPAILEVPLQVQVAPKGQITTSGARVPALSIAAANLLFAVVMLGSSAAMGIGFWWLDKQETTQFVDQEKG
jgi:hypothetical protein